ncbi:hypothetical protein BDN72DRAFT_963708 [Pluteus cervinus]|uniref:Uncharacterized protein n=1 Tax=Pluteus cervinus TaxID=181527 RepID=A0ACD3ACZ9_9AGAR|nr:hypothetical protein BDN72DRAFT_963708 [Pluteus cervinus]
MGSSENLTATKSTRGTDLGVSTESENEQLLFLTLLLHGLPRFGYEAYRSALEPFPLFRTQEVVDLSRLLCLLVRDKEILATIPVAAEGANGKYDLVVCWHSGADEPVQLRYGQDSTELPQVMPPTTEEIPTSHKEVKDIFLANIGLAWRPHANRVFHLLKRMKPEECEWLARYLLLANATHTLDMLRHPLRWAEVFALLKFNFDYDDLEEEGNFPYPSKKGLGRLLTEAKSTSVPTIRSQGLLLFLDIHSKPESTLVLNEELLREILVAIHHVFQSSLELISEAYNQIVASPRCVLGDSQTYEHITAISFAFHPLLEGEFLHWMINSLSTPEVLRIREGLMGSQSKEGSLRVDVDQGPHIIEAPHGICEDRSRQCWAWIHSCFDTFHNLEEVATKNKELSALNALKFFNFSPTDLSSAMSRGPTVIPNWEDVVPWWRKIYVNEEEDVPYDEIKPLKEAEVMKSFRSDKAGAVFAWINQREFVARPELHFEAFLATLHFAAVMGLEVEKASDDPRLKDILLLFKRNASRPIIGTSRPCCFTCREIIFGLSVVRTSTAIPPFPSLGLMNSEVQPPSQPPYRRAFVVLSFRVSVGRFSGSLIMHSSI